MIKRLQIYRLFDKASFDLHFNEDLNLLTGKNGSSKTTILKLIWFSISGNIERILPEIRFHRFELETDRFTLAFEIDRGEGRRLVEATLTINGQPKKTKRLPMARFHSDSGFAHELNREISRIGSSQFFPTFRRIEGGFSIGSQESRSRQVYFPGTVQNSLNELSETLSVADHKFVTSISTDDIVRLLTTRYADVSEKTNRMYADLSQFILAEVHAYQAAEVGSEQMVTKSATETLANIQVRANEVTQKREALLRPFSTLGQLITTMFQDKGIKVTDSITLGRAEEVISSVHLSAGEKQMLSFLCYNAFTDNASIFIDEPEISLHVDWQRILFPTLLSQASGNQFIVSTHSPFIYSKYPDKEILLDEDRGMNDADTATDSLRISEYNPAIVPSDHSGRGNE